MSRSSENVNLSDRYAILLDESLKENQALREELKERESQNVAKIDQLASKVETLCELLEKADQAGKGKKTSRTSSNVHVPIRCRTEFRKMYKALMEDDANFQGFYLEESASSSRNKAAFSVVADAINSDYGGREQCPWSLAQLRASFVTYLKSLKDTRKRRGAVDHNTVCRRQGRVREKIDRRIAVVEQMDWEEAKKERVKQCLTKEYTSSDESKVSEDESGDTTKRFVVKRLSWEGRKLRELKDSLDLYYRRRLNRSSIRLQSERVLSDSFSQRGPPENAPKWTLKNSYLPVATSTPMRDL